MTIQQLDRTYDSFYVPTFVIEVAGVDVVRDLFMTISSVSVDLKQKTPGRFSFTIASSFDWNTHEFLARPDEERIDLLELFAFGSAVEIFIGYGTPKEVLSSPTLTGLVTEISTDFAAGSTPELTVSGYDKLYALRIGKHTRFWEDKPDSFALEEVMGSRKISTTAARTQPVKTRIDQSQETDLSFVSKLAKRNGATYYLRDRKLHFGPRRNDKTAEVELTWGEGLVSFRPEANLARQITEVQVHARSAAKGEPIVGRARRGDETGRDTRAESGGDRVGTALSDSPVLKVRAAVHTQAEADARAKAILEERSQDFVKGSGESVGVPAIVPDTNIALDGLGRGFSKTYYVSEATHSIDSSGYKTSFRVEETTV